MASIDKQPMDTSGGPPGGSPPGGGAPGGGTPGGVPHGAGAPDSGSSNGGSYQVSVLSITLIVVVGSFMAVLDSAILNVALPKMMVLFGVDTKQIEWVLTSYMLVSGAIIPVTSYLGSNYGYKRVYLMALIAFTLGSMLCGLAWSNDSLVFFRVLQGIGGGLIMPTGMALMFALVPRSKMGMAMGIFGLSIAVAPSIGPTLGGAIIEEYSWRWLFMINLPIGVIGIALTQIFLPETPIRKSTHFDFWGLILSSGSAFLYLLALAEGGSWGWTSYSIVMLFFTATVMLALLIVVELNHPAPMLNLRLFKVSQFAVSTILSSGLAVALFTGVVLMPIYLQNVRGYSAIQTGLLLMPQALAMGAMMPVAGRLLDKVGPKPLLFVGLPLMIYTNYQLYALSLDTPESYINFLLIVRGLGLGLTMMPITAAGVNAVPRDQTGAASALNTLIRMVAGSFGIALTTTLMENRQFFHYHRMAENLDLFSPTWPMMQGATTSIVTAAGDPAMAQPATLSLMYGLLQMHATAWAIGDAFYVFSFGMVLLAPLGFFLRKTESKGGPAMAE